MKLLVDKVNQIPWQSLLTDYDKQVTEMTTVALSGPKPKVRGSDLPYEDGIPLESDWHLAAMTLLIEILRFFWQERRDVYVAGNMFVYFDPDQVKTRNFRGPDLFVVKGVKDDRFRRSWVAWEEEDLTPDWVLELASPSTVVFDLTDKKDIYEQILKTPEYNVYNPDSAELRGWRLEAGHYVPIKPNEQGWLWCSELDLWLGVVDQRFPKHPEPMKTPRFFDPQGRLLPTRAEAAAQRAEAEAQRAEAETQARRAAEAEIARLQALLAKKD